MSAVVSVHILIDNIVRQTTVLIAQLATSAGLRAPLAHVANQVFLELVKQLEHEGVGRKVIADMFGMALRTYQQKVRRLSESATERNRTLWEAVLDYLRQEGTASRTQILTRFRYDNEASVRGILHDLVESGLVFKSGRGLSTAYRAVSTEDFRRVATSQHNDDVIANLVWVTVHTGGRVTRDALTETLIMDPETLERALDTLNGEGHVEVDVDDRGVAHYRTVTCVVPLGAEVGWEGAVFDHYQAMVSALCAKLDTGTTRSDIRDKIGGSTYHFDVWPGHPHRERVDRLFAELRVKLSQLRHEVSDYSERHTPPDSGASRYTLYLGQLVRDEVNWTEQNVEVSK